MSTSVETEVLEREEADLLVRHTIGDAFDREGYDHLDAGSLSRKLAYYLDAEVDHNWVQEAIGALKDLQDIAFGVHEELHVNKARTVDNTDTVTAYYDGEFNVAVNTILDDADISGKWINRYSVPA